MSNIRGCCRNNFGINFGILALLLAVLMLLGCSRAPEQPLNTATQQIMPPDSAVWSADYGSQLWVTQESDGIFVVYERVASTGVSTAVHWSKTSMTQLASSFDGQFISFLQDDSVFVVIPDTRAVHRIAENIVSYAWSPSRPAMIMNTFEHTEYVEVSTDGTVVQTTVIRENEPLYGATFLDGKTLIGFQQQEDTIELVSYDLRALVPTVITTWQRPLLLAKESSSITLEVTDNHDLLTVTEQSADPAHFSSIVSYRFSTGVYEVYDAYQDEDEDAASPQP